LFRASWLTGYYPALGDLPQVKSDLNNLRVLDITPLDSPEPELAHLFKHIVTHEVTYESMPYATRAKLHELLAQYLESIYLEDPPLDAITYHYSQSENLPKKREYFRRSAEAAFAVYSNETALEYYKQALALSPLQDELIDLHLKSGTILEVIGKVGDAAAHYKAALQTAEENNFTERIIECQIKVGNTCGDYLQSLEWMNKALNLARQTNNSKGICDALNEISNINWRLGDFDTAEKRSQESLELARRQNDRKREAAALFFLASIHAEKGDYAGSHAFFEATLAIRRELNEPRLVGSTLVNWGTTYYYQGDYETAQKYIEESLFFYREIGDKRHTTIALNNLGNIFYLRNDYPTARGYYTEALGLGRELADKYTTSLALASLGITAFQEGKLEEADNCYREGMALSRALSYKILISLFHCYQGLLAHARGQTAAARNSFQEGLKIAHKSNMKAYIIYNLIGCACIYLAESEPSRAVMLLRVASANAEAMGFKIETELQRPYDRALDTAKKEMDEETFSAAWDKGQRMTMEEAVQLVLGNEKG
jgi:tetratricopeptide (TPR) repeat protein